MARIRLDSPFCCARALLIMQFSGWYTYFSRVQSSPPHMRPQSCSILCARCTAAKSSTCRNASKKVDNFISVCAIKHTESTTTARALSRDLTIWSSHSCARGDSPTSDHSRWWLVQVSRQICVTQTSFFESGFFPEFRPEFLESVNELAKSLWSKKKISEN